MISGRDQGFLAGAVGGLLLALLLVGAASFLPQHGPSLQPLSSKQDEQGGAPHAPAAATASSSNTSSGEAEFAGAGPASSSSSSSSTTALSAYAGAPASNKTSTTTTTIPQPNISSGRALSQASGSTLAPARGPSSLLVNLPGETLEGFLTTISPLLVGLIVAALIYGAYLRHQDSS